MTFLLGTLAAAVVGLLVVLCGYVVAGSLTNATILTRLGLASVLGLAWVIFFASVAGTLVPLNGFVAWLAWTPAVATIFVPPTRRQFMADIAAGLKSPASLGALAGTLLLWLTLLLPFLVFPDLAFFDGKTNHDNFFWCVGAEYLQHHDYLTIPGKNPDRPLFNLIWSFCGWQPAWARMGTEGFIAIASATFGLTPVRLYNFLASALAFPWLLLSLAIARQLEWRRLNGGWLGLVCFCQPVFFFFVANGNIPNLLGALFGGGIWLTLLIIARTEETPWSLGLLGALLVHGVLASYPEIFLFALAPAGLLAVSRLFARQGPRRKVLFWLAAVVIAGLCLNPVTTIRLWSGIQNSIVQAHHDSAWANIFDRISFAGYIPSLITLGVPTARLYGLIGGLVASMTVLGGVFLIFKRSKSRLLLALSLSGFFALLVYTLAASFGYGWQKSVQFSGVHFAVLFPTLAAVVLQESWQSRPRRPLSLVIMIGVFSLLLHGMIGVTAENLKSARSKGLTDSALAFHYQVEKELPDRPIYIDGPTFRASFFHSMWSAKVFPKNPLIFIQHEDQAGGYLWESVKTADGVPPSNNNVYYVAHEWAEAFDYDAKPVISDRVGSLLSQHNFVTALSGFYRATGVPQLAKPDFSLTIHPYADGWLEFVLAPNGTAETCQLHASVVAAGQTHTVDVGLDEAGHLVARFPLQANTSNLIIAKISGAPVIDSTNDESDHPFQIVSLRSGRTP